MNLLVLGGTHHAGRAIVEAPLERGDEVSTLNRAPAPRADAPSPDTWPAAAAEQRPLDQLAH